MAVNVQIDTTGANAHEVTANTLSDPLKFFGEDMPAIMVFKAIGVIAKWLKTIDAYFFENTGIDVGAIGTASLHAGQVLALPQLATDVDKLGTHVWTDLGPKLWNCTQDFDANASAAAQSAYKTAQCAAKCVVDTTHIAKYMSAVVGVAVPFVWAATFIKDGATIVAESYDLAIDIIPSCVRFLTNPPPVPADDLENDVIAAQDNLRWAKVAKAVGSVVTSLLGVIAFIAAIDLALPILAFGTFTLISAITKSYLDHVEKVASSAQAAGHIQIQ
ncbi:MAG: hypothetical protein S4CHLAM102_13210 [Chlamydiia bacterium]|nr:hypothetical protein [Chlamydiia bacterium]